jgi:hypothetical protein
LINSKRRRWAAGRGPASAMATLHVTWASLRYLPT